MTLDEFGLPKEHGASDLQDSARLAGILWTFGISDISHLSPNLDLYFDGDNKIFVRHPLERKYDFSRDQAICLFAGMKARSLWTGVLPVIRKEYVDGKDWFSPSHNAHIKFCRFETPNLLERNWIWLDVLWACYVDKEHENNQLLCMLLSHRNKKPLKFYLKNSNWEQLIASYWGGWRGERELAYQMIKYLNKVK